MKPRHQVKSENIDVGLKSEELMKITRNTVWGVKGNKATKTKREDNKRTVFKRTEDNDSELSISYSYHLKARETN